MQNLSKVSHLNGIVLTLKSGNIARMETIGPGGIRVNYLLEPSNEDMEEARVYLLSKLEPNTKMTEKVHLGSGENVKAEEAENYRKFLSWEDE